MLEANFKLEEWKIKFIEIEFISHRVVLRINNNYLKNNNHYYKLNIMKINSRINTQDENEAISNILATSTSHLNKSIQIRNCTDFKCIYGFTF